MAFGNGNTALATDAMEPDYAVPAAIASTQSIVSDLETSVSRLRDRLTPVIAIRPEGKADAKLRSSSSVPLADQIDTITSRVREANESLLDLLDRLHV